jgi:MFS family permease
MLGLALSQMIACICAGRFIDTFGRKFLILRGQVAVIVILVVIYLTDNTFESLSKDLTHYLLIALIYIHVIVFNFTLGPICILYAA